MKLTTILLVMGVFFSAAATAEDAPTPVEALEKLKGLEGRWEGHVMTPDGPQAAVDYRITAAGSTVMEVMFPGTPHEMVSMFHLDGDRLVAKHYCASGTQPAWVYDPESSTGKTLRFTFEGGTNLDPEKDAHMHGGTMTFESEERLENVWDQFQGATKIEENRFFLERK